MTIQALAPVVVRVSVDAVATGTDTTTPVCVAPVAGTVLAVRYVPTTVLTGADTNSRTITLRNRAQGGAGTTAIATRAYVSGVNISANVVGDLPVTAANATVAKGDVLDWDSDSIGTGLADPGGLVEVVIQPSLG